MEGLTPEILEGPSAAPPPGVIPNLVDPPNEGQLLIVLPAVLIAMMWLSVFGRLFVKLRVIKIKTPDDLTCVVAALLTTLYFGITVASVKYQHVGTHLWDVKLGDYISLDSIKVDYLALIMAPLTLLFIKSSFFLMFLYIFRPMYAVRVACYVGLAITVLGYMGWFIAFMALGTPVRGETWQAHFVGSTQAKAANMSIPLPAFGLALDLIILILPIYGVLRLQLSRKRKIGVLAIFLTAIVAILCSILSIVYRVNVQREGEADLTWDLMPAYLTSALEMNLGVIILCMPTFSTLVQASQPFYNSIRSRLSSLGSKSRSQPSQDDFSSNGNHSHGSQHGSSSKGAAGYTYIESTTITDAIPDNRDDANNIHLTTVIHQDRCTG